MARIKKTRLWVRKSSEHDPQKLGLWDTMEDALAWADENWSVYAVLDEDEGFPSFTVSVEWVEDGLRAGRIR